MIFTKQIGQSVSQHKDNWGTPDYIFEPLNAEFNFTLDPCCEPETAKCKRFYTVKSNGLIQNWQGETVFVNPPYSRGNVDSWVWKCYIESKKPNTIIVALLPVSTSSNWFHKYIYGKAEIRFLKGRLKFKGAKDSAPFSSMIIIWECLK